MVDFLRVTVPLYMTSAIPYTRFLFVITEMMIDIVTIFMGKLEKRKALSLESQANTLFYHE